MMVGTATFALHVLCFTIRPTFPPSITILTLLHIVYYLKMKNNIRLLLCTNFYSRRDLRFLLVVSKNNTEQHKRLTESLINQISHVVKIQNLNLGPVLIDQVCISALLNKNLLRGLENTENSNSSTRMLRSIALLNIDKTGYLSRHFMQQI